MAHIRWVTLSCAFCPEKLLVPIGTLRRVADGVTFVACLDCTEKLELEVHSITFHELPGDYEVPADVRPVA